MSMKRFVVIALLSCAATPALAHTGHGPVDSFSAGLMHPISGPDHLLAMVAVGLWAALAAPRLFWVAPTGFLSGMLAGGFAGIAGLMAPGVELIIVGSVIVFGFLALSAARLPALVAFTAAAAFGAAHGVAHGAEMPADGSALEYAAGFVLATAVLHAFGVGIGLTAQRFQLNRVGRAAGGAVALAGTLLMIG